MAKEVKVSIIVDDNGSMRLTEKSAKKLGGGMNKVAKSASTADRALKGTAQASSNSTKNFSKMSQGITGGLVPAYATLAANVFAITALFQAFKQSADITNLISGQKALGAVTGIAYGTITTGIREATNGMLSFKEAASATAIGISSGLSSGQLEGLATAAKNASAVLGRDLTDSFNRLIRGVTKAEPELLDELGIILRLEDASKKYAESLNITGRRLTTFEKQQAVANDVLTQAEEKYGKIAGIIDPAGQAVNRLGASFDELLIPLQQFITRGAAPVFDFLSENLASFSALLSVAALSFAKSFLPAIPVMAQLGGSVNDSAQSILKLGNASSKTIKTIRSTDEWLPGQLKILEKAAKSKTSTVLNGSREERKAILRDIRIISAAHKTQLAEQATGWNKYFLRISAGYARATAEAGKFFGTLKFLTAGLGKLLGALPLIGLIFLAIDLGKQLYQSFFPIPEYIEKANAAADKFIQTSSSLNEELQNSVQIRKQVALSTSEIAIQTGNAIKSAEVLSKIQAFKAFSEDADPEKINGAFKELEKTFENLTKLDARFKPFLAGLESLKEGGKFELTAEFSLLQSQIVEGATALEKWPETLKTIKDGLLDIVNVKTVDPFAKVSLDIAAGIEQGTKALDSLRAAQTQVNMEAMGAQQRSIGRKQEIREELEFLKERKRIQEDVLKSKASRMNNGDLTQSGKIAQSKVTQRGREIKQLEKEVQAITNETEKRNDAIRDGTKAIAQQKLDNQRLLSLQTALNNSSGERTRILGEQEAATLNISELQTAGISLEQKLSNIRASDIQAKDQVLKAELGAIAAANNLVVVKDKANMYTQAELDAAIRLDRLAQNGVTIAKNDRDIQLEKNRAEEAAIFLTKEKLRADEAILAISRKQASTQLDLQRAQSGIGLGNFGIAQQKAITEEKINQAKLNKDSADQQLINAQRAQNELRFSALTAAIEDTELANAEKRVQLAQDSVASMKEALRQARDWEQSSTNQLNTAVESSEREFNTVGLLGKKLYVQQQINSRIASGQLQTVDAIENAKVLLGVEYENKQILENKLALQNSFVNSFSDSINGLIQGTMTLKDAFKNVALSVLKQLSQMITQALVFKLLMGTSFGGSIMSTLGGVGGSIPVTGRNGGVFSAGKKMGGYADGGIAKGSTSGYPAILHGTEAVVPLPDGKSIPVSMNGSGQNNNVTVNVSMDGQGGSSSDSSSNGQQGANIGKLIAGAVQEELQRQKRPGGILSPYGAA